MSYNVIYIHSHDSGKFISPYGFNLDTPQLEKIAETSNVFHNAFAVAPTCSPSRTAMLSSSYPHENGMLGLVNRGFRMNNFDRHIVRWLNKVDYETVLCGIQHEAAHYHESEKAANIIGYQKNLTTDLILQDLDDKRVWDKENTSNLTNWLINRENKRPFFASLGFYCTHRPYPNLPDSMTSFKKGVPKGFIANKVLMEDFQKYNESIKHVDECFGKVISTLKKINILDETIIIFTTDHGIAYPFGKSNLTNLGLEVSLIIRLPGATERVDFDNLVSQLDIVPTICDYLNIKPEFSVRGKSLRPLIDNHININDELFFEMNFHTSYEPARAVRSKRFKYIEFLEDYERYQLSNINDSNIKEYFIEQGLGEKLKAKQQFYDLLYDPDEKNNLIYNPEYSSIIKEFQRKLNKWRKETGDHEINNLVWEKDWVVNKKESTKQKGSSAQDYIEGHVPSKYL